MSARSRLVVLGMIVAVIGCPVVGYAQPPTYFPTEVPLSARAISAQGGGSSLPWIPPTIVGGDSYWQLSGNPQTYDAGGNAFGVNANGTVIVGTDPVTGSAYLYTQADGTVPLPGGDGRAESVSFAEDPNDTIYIAGKLRPGSYDRPAKWSVTWVHPEGGGPPEPVISGPEMLAVPADTSSAYAEAVNDAGAVAGWSWDDEYFAFRAHRWDTAGNLETLPGLSSDEWSFGAQAFDINGLNEAVGTSDDGEWNNRAVMWDAAGIAHDLGTLGEDVHSDAYAINNDGLIVGRSGEYGDYKAVIVQGGMMYDLNDYLNGDWPILVSAIDINEHGAILAYDEDYTYYVLTTAQVPEPATLSVLALGGLLWLRRRES